MWIKSNQCIYPYPFSSQSIRYINCRKASSTIPNYGNVCIRITFN